MSQAAPVTTDIDEPNELDIETQFDNKNDTGEAFMVSVPSWLLHSLSAPECSRADKRMAFNIWLDKINPTIRANPLRPREDPHSPFQRRVEPWMQVCFGPEISADKEERNHRFFEESTELVQACGMTASEAHQLVDYVFGRPVGEKTQESGGVSVTHAALCLAHGMDMHEAAEIELDRIWGKVEQIRAKQAAKPKHSPLPEAPIYAISCVKPGRSMQACASNCSCLGDSARPGGYVVRIGEHNGGPYDMKGGAA